MTQMDFSEFRVMLRKLHDKMIDPWDELYVKNFHIASFQDHCQRDGFQVQFYDYKGNNDYRFLFHVRFLSSQVTVSDDVLYFYRKTEDQIRTSVYHILRNMFIREVLLFRISVDKYDWTPSDMDRTDVISQDKFQRVLRKVYARMVEPGDGWYVKNISIPDINGNLGFRPFSVMLQRQDSLEFLFHVSCGRDHIVVGDKGIMIKYMFERELLQLFYKTLRNKFIEYVTNSPMGMSDLNWQESDIVTIASPWQAIHRIASILESHLVCND